MEYTLLKFIGFNLGVITAIALFIYCQYWGGYWGALCKPNMRLPDGVTLSDARFNRWKHFMGTLYGMFGTFGYIAWATISGWYVEQLNKPEVEQFITMFAVVLVVVITVSALAEWVFNRKEKG